MKWFLGSMMSRMLRENEERFDRTLWIGTNDCTRRPGTKVDRATSTWTKIMLKLFEGALIILRTLIYIRRSRRIVSFAI